MGDIDSASTLTLAVVTPGMTGTHRIFRREFPLTPPLVSAVRDGDTDRAEVLASHIRLLLELVHVHHEAEERFLWQLLPERAPADTAIVETMLHQHGDIAGLAARIDQSLAEWVATPTGATSAALVAALEDFTGNLVSHADLEEGETLGLIADHLSLQEWHAFVAFAVTAMPEDVRSTVMGMMMEDMAPPAREALLGNLPEAFADQLRTAGADAYAAYTARVRNG